VADPSICGGHWQTPRNCDPEQHNCEYYAKWEHLHKKDEVRFTVETKHTTTWTGIAFSNDTKMVSHVITIEELDSIILIIQHFNSFRHQ
jgi:hypothetical protein